MCSHHASHGSNSHFVTCHPIMPRTLGCLPSPIVSATKPWTKVGFRRKPKEFGNFSSQPYQNKVSIIDMVEIRAAYFLARLTAEHGY